MVPKLQQGGLNMGNISPVAAENLDRAAELLRSGELVAVPTETVYGLAGNAFMPNALAKIFEVKQRPLFDPLIVHCGSAEAAFALASSVPQQAQALASRFWPGPLTMVLMKNGRVPDLATSGGNTVAVRVPAHPVAQALLGRLDFPLAAPSANRFGRISPTNAMAVHAELGDAVPMILDGGPCQVGVESTVLDLTGDQPRLLRAGGVGVEELEAVLGKVELSRQPVSDGPVASPGLLKSHYAPRKALRIVQDLAEIPWQTHSGWLAFGSVTPQVGPFPGVKDNISPKGDLTEAATHFFQGLRFLDDHPQISIIFAQLFPEKGLGRALNDRLRRAEGR